MNFNTVDLPKFGSQICISAFPGRDRGGIFSKKQMDQFFEFLEAQRYHFIVSLLELSEFDQYIPASQFENAISQRDLSWRHHPLKDMTAPTDRFLLSFSPTLSLLLKKLRAGENVVLHCKGGLGRSGTVAAMLLQKLGFSGAESIKMVRSSRPGAIETVEQERFILSIKK